MRESFKQSSKIQAIIFSHTSKHTTISSNVVAAVGIKIYVAFFLKGCIFYYFLFGADDIFSCLEKKSRKWIITLEQIINAVY